jgi:hypothetical protein
MDVQDRKIRQGGQRAVDRPQWQHASYELEASFDRCGEREKNENERTYACSNRETECLLSYLHAPFIIFLFCETLKCDCLQKPLIASTLSHERTELSNHSYVQTLQPAKHLARCARPVSNSDMWRLRLSLHLHQHRIFQVTASCWHGGPSSIHRGYGP